MRATSFLIGLVLIIGVYEARQATSISRSSAKLILDTLMKKPCDKLKIRLACFQCPYRTFDGTCNNLCNVTNGAADEPFARFPNLSTPTAYEGDNFGPRSLSVVTSPTGETFSLKNTREISKNIFQSDSGTTPSRVLTHIAMIFGQFSDHDLTQTKSIGAECGTNDEQCVVDPGQCTGINITASSLRLEGRPEAVCIPLTRSFRNAIGDQINIITHWLDGSQIYGSNKVLAGELRDLAAKLGLLRVRAYPPNSNTGPILPVAEEGFCRSENPDDEPCLIAGDERVNENQALAAMHTVWVREHNRIAIYLHNLNPTWDDERLYQEARKIVIAELQHITYNEWLAAFFSEKTRKENGVFLLDSGFFELYDPHLKVAITNVFATAALRMGHTLIGNAFNFSIKDVPPGNQPQSALDFFNPSPLYMDVLGSSPYGAIMNGLVHQPAEDVDGTFGSRVREELIVEGPTINGTIGDLPAINMQRAREHGLPSWAWYRQACGLLAPIKFRDLQGIFPDNVIRLLIGAYASTFDMDVFVAIHEIPKDGNVLGPTFTCIIMKQFSDLRRGDRFWYERDDCLTGFTAGQLGQIRKSSMARVLCDNLFDVKKIQEKVFLPANDTSNPKVHCCDLPFVDLNFWKEEHDGNVKDGKLMVKEDGGPDEANAAVGA